MFRTTYNSMLGRCYLACTRSWVQFKNTFKIQVNIRMHCRYLHCKSTQPRVTWEEENCPEFASVRLVCGHVYGALSLFMSEGPAHHDSTICRPVGPEHIAELVEWRPGREPVRSIPPLTSVPSRAPILTSSRMGCNLEV